MMGQVGLNGNNFVKYVSPVNEEHARRIIKGIQSHPDFTNRDTVLGYANNFFYNGGSYGYLNSIAGDFVGMKNIRNAISHTSPESLNAFYGVVRSKLGSVPAKITISGFLNSFIPGSSITFFSYYKGIAVNAINQISNP